MVTKRNRRAVAGACFLLAAKFNANLIVDENDILDEVVSSLVDKLAVRRGDIFRLEFDVMVQLEFNLWPATEAIVPQFSSLLQSIDVVPQVCDIESFLFGMIYLIERLVAGVFGESNLQ